MVNRNITMPRRYICRMPKAGDKVSDGLNRAVRHQDWRWQQHVVLGMQMEVLGFHGWMFLRNVRAWARWDEEYWMPRDGQRLGG